MLQSEGACITGELGDSSREFAASLHRPLTGVLCLNYACCLTPIMKPTTPHLVPPLMPFWHTTTAATLTRLLYG